MLLPLLLVLPAVLVTVARAQISEPPHNSCLCVSTPGGLNFRSSACGDVLQAHPVDTCFTYLNRMERCMLDGSFHDFYEMDHNGVSGWASGNFLRIGSAIECDILEAPYREFRSFFLTTAWNIDWPSNHQGWISAAQQQSEMIDYLDLMDDTNMNACIMQVRPASDAFYDSPIEPWSRFLTGAQGTPPSPAWDPLAFAVDEAHARGIEMHAWLNPYRASMNQDRGALAPGHVALQYPQYAREYSTSLWMDPGADEVIDWLVAVVEDIATRYDVDGILFDDYFYPYPVGGQEFPDDDVFQRYLDGGGSMSRDDWRRDNVNRMIERVYSRIHEIKPHLKFGISPFGIFRPGHPDGHPPPIVGLDPFSAIYADALLWLQQGWMDYNSPQLYWAEDPPAQRYSTLLDWWIDPNHANPLRRHTYTANGAYRLSDAQDWPVSELVRQVDISRDLTRRYHHSYGNIFFSANAFMNDVKGLRTTFASQVYPNRAVTPNMPWLDVAPAVKPSIRVQGKSLHIRCEAPETVHKYLLFKHEAVAREMRLDRVVPGTQQDVVLESGYYSIKAMNRAGEESDKIFFTIP